MTRHILQVSIAGAIQKSKADGTFRDPPAITEEVMRMAAAVIDELQSLGMLRAVKG
jgi:hypothetical protein